MISLSVISCFIRIAMLSLLFLSIIAGGERIGKSGLVKNGNLSLILAHILFNTPSIAIQRKAGTPQEVSLPFRIGCLANATLASLPLKQSSAAGIISHSTNALPKARQASSAASSGVSVQITLSQTRFTPALSQSLSQVRIHSPSPQP